MRSSPRPGTNIAVRHSATSSVKIGVDIRHLTHPHLSGVGLSTLNILRALSRIGGDVEFVLFAAGSKKTLARLPGLPKSRITVVQYALPNRLLFALLRAGRTLESFLPTPIDAWWFPDANIIRTKLPYALTVHDLSSDILPQFFTLKDRLRNRIADVRGLTARATHLLAVSESTRHDLLHRWAIDANRITVTPLGVAPHYTPHRAPSDQNYQRGYGLTSPYLLCLATQEPRKNLESVIEAYDAYRLASPHTPRLIIAGATGWKHRRIHALANASAHRKDIVFIGYVHEKHKPALYRGALAFLFPSFYEGFGLPVLEAMACGTPVVTSFTSSLPEVVGDAGILIDPLNVNDIQAALHQLLDGPQGIRQSLSARGAQRAKSFTWDETAKRTLAALRNLCYSPTYPRPSAAASPSHSVDNAPVVC